jgi:hypothetical protein
MLAAGLSTPRAIIEDFNAINNNFLSTALGLHYHSLYPYGALIGFSNNLISLFSTAREK